MCEWACFVSPGVKWCFNFFGMMVAGAFIWCFIGFIVLRLSFMIRVHVLVVSIFDIVVVMNICVLSQERSLRVLPILRIADLAAGLNSWPAPSERQHVGAVHCRQYMTPTSRG